MRRIPWLPLFRILTVSVVVALFAIYWPEQADLSSLAGAGDDYAADILRDSWGVPHIFGERDADVAFGLAYAHAEDDFLTIQQSLIAARGKLAAVYGADAAPNDYMVALLRIWPAIDAAYERDLTPDTRAVMEGYAAGLNQYAYEHPQQVIYAPAFPITGKDVVAGSVHKSPLFFGLDDALGELFADERRSDVSAEGGAAIPDFAETRYGSNTFAVAPSRTEDGSTFLAVNSHQPWSGPVAWYEASVHSAEGWHMTGGLFPGSPVVIHGHNPDLGWAFTVNHPDLVDVYVLEMNPENPNQYRYDGAWVDLEVGETGLDVKLWRRLHWTVQQEILWSVHGPVVRRPYGVYAVRYAGMGRVDLWQQLYRMNRATNFEAWRKAAGTRGLPTFNVGYADREGNIYYLYNGLLPQRAEGYDWSLYLPGDRSETLWDEVLPFDELPQVHNPASGFVINSNSTPFQATQGPDNPDPARFSPTLGIETEMTNRGLRAMEIFSADESIAWEEFVAGKFDMRYSQASDVARYVRQIAEMPLAPQPEIQSAQKLLAAWDLSTDPENRAAALGVLLLYFLDEEVEGLKGSQLVGLEVDDDALASALEKATEWLLRHFERLDPPWGEVNRLRRGEVDLALGGGPDILHAVYGAPGRGVVEAHTGDCYVLLVRWHPDGAVSSYSIHQFGSATLDSRSTHYADQAPLFADRRLKPVWFSEADIRANLEREYRVGGRP